jgi:succinyl-CoA synthetase beta subunit
VKLFEYEAKEIFAKYKIPVPEGAVCENKTMIEEAYGRLGPNVALKAQVLTGGRGKAGGILFPQETEEATEMGERLLGKKIKEERAEKILIERALAIEKEYYLGIIVDTDEGCPLLMFSAKGGVDIETLAKENPAAIKKAHINPLLGVSGHQVRILLKEAAVPREHHQSIIQVARALYRVYWDMDGELIEINPLVVTQASEIVAADAKFTIDDNGLYRQLSVPKRAVETIEDRAAETNMSFIELDGDIGIISNGAGLTMATMDLLQLYGGKPANFLDGKDALSKEGLKAGIDFIQENERVKSILINIFAGGPRCDEIAQKIVETLTHMENAGALQMPVVVTLHGRYMDQGRKILSEYTSPHFFQEVEIEDAVRKVIALGKKSNEYISE